jgi:hypothetical protein
MIVDVVILIIIFLYIASKREGFRCCNRPPTTKDLLRLNPFYFPYTASPCMDGKGSHLGDPNPPTCDGLPESYPAFIRLTSKAVPDHVLLTN